MACRQGNLSRVTELLSVANVDVNARDNFGWTPLHEAIAHGRVEVVKLLLDFKPKNTLHKFLNKAGPEVDLWVAAGSGEVSLKDFFVATLAILLTRTN